MRQPHLTGERTEDSKDHVTCLRSKSRLVAKSRDCSPAGWRQAPNLPLGTFLALHTPGSFCPVDSILALSQALSSLPPTAIPPLLSSSLPHPDTHPGVISPPAPSLLHQEREKIKSSLRLVLSDIWIAPKFVLSKSITLTSLSCWPIYGFVFHPMRTDNNAGLAIPMLLLRRRGMNWKEC